MNKIAWIVAGIAIVTGLGAAVIPIAGSRIQHAHAQEMAQAEGPVDRSSSMGSRSLPQAELKLAPPTPIAAKKAELGDDRTWNPEWDLWIETALPPELLSPTVAKAVKPFCPRFNAVSEVDKRAFWAYFFQALAGAEAGLVPTRDVRHMDPVLQVKDDVTHRMVRQEGLLQLTYMDQERYGCDFDWEKDRVLDEHDARKTILQPKNNLLCGVRIIRNQLIDQHKPLLSSTSYFATLQPGTISVKVFLRQMANVPEVCRRPIQPAPAPVPQVREAEETAPAAPPSSAPRVGFDGQSAASLTH